MSELAWLVALCVDYGLVALAMMAVHWSPWLLIPAMLLIGCRQHALLILGHEGAHCLISRRRWLNDMLANLLCFWPLGMGLSGYRKFHLAHHRYVGTSRDPEVALKRDRYKLPISTSGILIQAAVALAGGATREVVAVILFVQARGTVLDLLAPAVLWACLLWASWSLALLWFASAMTALGAAHTLRVWQEHVGTGTVQRVHAGPFYRFLFLPHNIGFHHEHHEHPSIPFWGLPFERDLDTGTPVQSIEDLFRSYGEKHV
jgi:fatty acid desaturase